MSNIFNAQKQAQQRRNQKAAQEVICLDSDSDDENSMKYQRVCHRTMSNHDIHEAESIRVLIRLRPEEKNEIQKYGAPCAKATGVDEKAIAISSNYKFKALVLK